ncbi:hypothetical protein MalM25_01040 [Planctomycetes bacterium MalM25]|nr:hypothetical protein MalM25_01040 [Planctomycetes bacterium MalM25]
MTTKRLVSTYCLAQAVAGGLWWWLVLARPEVREAFWSDSITESVLLSFAFADIPLLVIGSAILSHLVARGSKRAVPVAWIVAGSAVYAGLFCVGQLVTTGEAVAAVVAMGFAVIGSVWAAVNTA